MYRSRSVERLRREWAREREQLLRIVEQQNNKLLWLIDRPWELPPRPSAGFEEAPLEEEDIDFSPDQAFDEVVE